MANYEHLYTVCFIGTQDSGFKSEQPSEGNTLPSPALENRNGSDKVVHGSEVHGSRVRVQETGGVNDARRCLTLLPGENLALQLIFVPTRAPEIVHALRSSFTSGSEVSLPSHDAKVRMNSIRVMTIPVKIHVNLCSCCAVANLNSSISDSSCLHLTLHFL